MGGNFTLVCHGAVATESGFSQSRTVATTWVPSYRFPNLIHLVGEMCSNRGRHLALGKLQSEGKVGQTCYNVVGRTGQGQAVTGGQRPDLSPVF